MQLDYQSIINKIYKKVKAEANHGKIATYIPALGEVDVDKFGISLQTVDGQSYQAGDYDHPFSIQSIAKVMALALAYEFVGEKIWKRVHVEPSGMPFNSLIQLELENGIPRNPLINMMSILQNPKERLDLEIML